MVIFRQYRCRVGELFGISPKEAAEKIEAGDQVEIDFGLPDDVTITEPVKVTMHLSKLED